MKDSKLSKNKSQIEKPNELTSNFKKKPNQESNIEPVEILENDQIEFSDSYDDEWEEEEIVHSDHNQNEM